jgi:hypothetical protein
MTSKKNLAAKDRCQEPSTFVSGVGQNRAQTIAIVQAALKSHIHAKYAISSRIHYLRPIDSILGGTRDHLNIEFRFLEDFSTQKELLRRMYKRRESRDKISALCEYFKYHYEIPRIFAETFIHIIDGFHDRRRHQIYQRVKQLIGKENIVGDESHEDEHKGNKEAKPGFSMLLKGLKPMAPRPMVKVPGISAPDTLQRIIQQIGSTSKNTSMSDMSSITSDNFNERQNSFLKFMGVSEKDEAGKEASALKRSGSGMRQTLLISETPLVKEQADLMMKKQKKPTIVKVKPSLVMESNGLKKLVGKALLEPKKSPRENIISGNRNKVTGGTYKQVSKTEASEPNLQFKKSMATINNFRKEIEEFHLTHSLSTRTGGLFKSFLEKGMLTTNKSNSPQLNLLTSTRSGLNSMKILNSEPSPKLRTKFLMNMSKDQKPGQRVADSPQPSQKLLSVRSTGTPQGPVGRKTRKHEIEANRAERSCRPGGLDAQQPRLVFEQQRSQPRLHTHQAAQVGRQERTGEGHLRAKTLLLVQVQC